MDVMTAQVAKTQFGELLMKAQREPVEITKHGKRVAIMMSAEEYDLLTSSIRAAAEEGMQNIKEGRVTDGPEFMKALRLHAASRAKRK